MVASSSADVDAPDRLPAASPRDSLDSIPPPPRSASKKPADIHPAAFGFRGVAALLPMPNFVLLDKNRSDLARLLIAMMQAREAVNRQAWSHPQEPKREDWRDDVSADPPSPRRHRCVQAVPMGSLSTFLSGLVVCSDTHLHRTLFGLVRIGLARGCG
jgi:hypothetical protein